MADATFRRSVRIARPAAEVFAWHERPGALARLCPPWERVELVSATGGVRDGARVTVRNKVGPFWTEWRVEHRDYVAGRQFRDVQVAGPFARWEHLHRIDADGPDACVLTDDIVYRLPGGAPGRAVAGKFTERKLAAMFAWRQERTKADVELASRYGTVRPRRILIAGASGMVLTTPAGLIASRLVSGVPEIDLQPVTDVRATMSIDLADGEQRIGFAVAGIPHLVILCENADAVDVARRGPGLRRHAASGLAGANVNWVSPMPGGEWRYRTFERGVEGETLACGTGAVATAVLLEAWGLTIGSTVVIRTSSRRDLEVRLRHTAAVPNSGGGVNSVGWQPTLRGEGRVVYRGVIEGILAE